MVNLTTLAPDIVAAILDESLPSHVTLFDLASGTPLLWEEQRALLRHQPEGSCDAQAPANAENKPIDSSTRNPLI
jgi:hypothetical protein